jgi:hypothetical protein
MGQFDTPLSGADIIANLRQQVADLAVAISPEAQRFVGAAGQPAFTNSWVNFDSVRPVGFYRHLGRVYLTGVAKSGTVGAAIFTLPAGYRPAETDAANPLVFSRRQQHGLRPHVRLRRRHRRARLR